MRPTLHLVALSLLSAILAGCDSQPVQAPNDTEISKATPAGEVDRSQAGTAAPDTRFQDPEGDPVLLADFRGRPLLLNLWATWCAPCITEMPTLDALAARDQHKLQVLAVSQDMEGKPKVDAFFAKHGYRQLEPYVDPESQLSSDLKVLTLPTTILYNSEGKEVWRMTGIEDWQSPRAAALIAEAERR